MVIGQYEFRKDFRGKINLQCYEWSNKDLKDYESTNWCNQKVLIETIIAHYGFSNC